VLRGLGWQGSNLRSVLVRLQLHTGVWARSMAFQAQVPLWG
jgi:hypothetical protein